MNAQALRIFEDKPGVRGPTPLLFGLIGPSGSGKTYSAGRLATGMQRVFGGEIFVIDTEADRALHYAEIFRFRHVSFAAPFAPGDYRTAIQHCVSRGAKTIIIDSMSHEHEGQGGVLEWHAREVERIMAAWKCSEQTANVPAWGKPKAARRELINYLLQVRCNFILCFRAKDKIKISKGADGKSKVTQLGFMPIAGEEFVYELTAKSLLLPGANGVPTWQSDEVGERLMIKLPEQFRGIFSGADGKPLDESIGEQMAKWAAGGKPLTVDSLICEYQVCADAKALKALEDNRSTLWGSANADQKRRLKAAADDAGKRIAGKQQEPADAATWAATLRGQTNSAELEQAWKACCETFPSMPVELDEAYQITRETLVEREAKQEEL